MILKKLNEALTSRKSFIQDRVNFSSVGFALLINIIHWVVLLIKIAPGSNSILLHYNVVYGSDFVEKSMFIYLIPTTALCLFFVNVILGAYFFNKEKALTYFLIFSNIAVQLVFFVASVVLIIANQR